MGANWGSGLWARSKSSFVWSIAFTAACASGGGGGGCGGGGAADLVFEDENNYAFSSDFETTQLEEIEAQADAVVDWSAMTTDIRGRPLDPSTVEQISLLNIKFPPEEVFRMIAENEIGQEDAQDIYLFVNSDDATTANLSDFEITDIPMELSLLIEDTQQTWLMSLMNVPDGRNDILATAVITPKAGSTDHEITFTDGISELTNLVVDISGAVPLTTSEGKAPYSMDWSGVTVDTFGHEFDSLLADELIIGHYSGDVASVEGNFLQLDTIADELYRLDVFGVTGESLMEAEDASGNKFEGFTADGTWLVGIICSGCATPVPLILGHVIVE
jgi:hypothetical protein